MIQITQMGYPSLIVPIIVLAIFGVDFKKGFLLLQLFLWTDLVTTTLKILVEYPRPYYVDKKVINLENNATNTSHCGDKKVINLENNTTSTSLFSGNGIKDIFALPDNQILKTFHLQEACKLSSLGFPSGHVSLTTVLWEGIATVYNSRLIRILTPFAIVLMAFSRVYLGKHFIGDVFGGLIVGLISLGVFKYFLKSPLKRDFFKKESFELVLRRQNLIFYCFMFIIPIILIILSLVRLQPLNPCNIADLFGMVGPIFGMNIAYLLIIRKGIPDSIGSTEQRATRAFIAFLLFEVSKIILETCFCIGQIGDHYLCTMAEKTTYPPFAFLKCALIGFLKTFIPVFTIWVSVVICTKLNLYRKNEESL
jgi:membrane-associated phospholipid phosphatase